MGNPKTLKHQQDKAKRKEQELREEDTLFREWLTVIDARLRRWYPERYQETKQPSKPLESSSENEGPGKLWKTAPYEVSKTKQNQKKITTLFGQKVKSTKLKPKALPSPASRKPPVTPEDFFADFHHWAFNEVTARRYRKVIHAENKQLQREVFLDEYFGKKIEECFWKRDVKPWDHAAYAQYGDVVARRDRWCAEEIDFIRCCWHGGYEGEDDGKG